VGIADDSSSRYESTELDKVHEVVRPSPGREQVEDDLEELSVDELGVESVRV
jgi:hypothetical protein